MCEPKSSQLKTKDLNYFSPCALIWFNTRVSQFELNYWNKWTFPRHSALLSCTCMLFVHLQSRGHQSWTVGVVSSSRGRYRWTNQSVSDRPPGNYSDEVQDCRATVYLPTQKNLRTLTIIHWFSLHAVKKVQLFYLVINMQHPCVIEMRLSLSWDQIHLHLCI